MPSAGWHKQCRNPAFCERDLERFRNRHPERFPQFQRPAEISRGAMRLASEAILARMAGEPVPEDIMGRALLIADEMARG